MDIKQRPNENIYREIIRRMTYEQKIQKIVELNELGKELFVAGYLDRNPNMTLDDARSAYRQYKIKCPNNNY
jgi:hypothetical protein